MLRAKIEGFLWPWERALFDDLLNFVERVSKEFEYIAQIKQDVLKILEGKYKVEQKENRLWIYRRINLNHLASIWED